MRIILPIAALLLGSCADDRGAGTTTTTSNGGLVALHPDGKPAPGGIVLAARTWNVLAGTPGIVDTLRCDPDGFVPLDRDTYAFIEVRDTANTLGAWVGRGSMPNGIRQAVRLDTLRRVVGHWQDAASTAASRLILDSSFQSAPIRSDDGSFAIERVPAGRFRMLVGTGAARPRPMGVLDARTSDVRYEGSGNIIVSGDTTRSPLWVDDFESGSGWPLLRTSAPGVSPWYMWRYGAEMHLPASSAADSVRKAIGPDSTRTGKVLHTRFATTDPNAQVAIGITNMEIDLRARTEVCLGYRADGPLRIELQRDSIGQGRPALAGVLRASTAWKDTCAAIADFAPHADTPDSLKTWSAFGRKVLVLEFSTSAGSTFMDLDDIRLR